MDNVLVTINGEELELRPINARQYLMARMETEIASETFGEDQVSKAILMGAGLLAKSLFFNDERLFKSMEDVLDALTAEEIVTTAEYIDLEPDIKTKALETAEKIKALNGNRSFSEKPYFSFNNGYLRTFNNKYEGGESKAYSAVHMRINEFATGRSLSPHSDMQRVSDFFQRDSRRYDGIIAGY